MDDLPKQRNTVDLLSKYIGALLHPVALFIFLAEFEQFQLPEKWRIQFSLVLLFSFLLTLLLQLTYVFYKAQILFILRFLALLILGFPLGDDLLIEGVLLAALIFDVFLWHSPAVGSIISSVLLVLSVLLQRSILVWDYLQPRPSWENLLGFFLLNMMMILVFYFFNCYRLRARTNRVLIDSYEDTVSNLMEANLKLQDNIMKEIGDTLNSERKRIARELHDIIGHSMVNIMMLSESLRDKMSTEPALAAEMTKTVNSEAQKVVHDTEKTLRYLKDRDSERKYDIAAVKRLVNVFEKATGVTVDLELRNAPNSFGRNINRVVYRSIQECMTNSFRHGKASLIKIMFWKGEDEVEIIIRDNGTGTKDIEEGIGLWGIRERLAAIDGKLEVQNSRDGFIVIVKFPWGRRP